MAAGPLPKAAHSRERDTRRRQADAVTLHPDGIVRGPELTGSWSPGTIDYYETWRRSAQAQLFTDTDWLRLRHVVLPLVELNGKRPAAAYAAEIRLNEERWGALYGDRVRMKMRVETGPVALSPEAETPRAPVSIADRLRRDPAPEKPAPF
jgi:hypothetical protein